MTPSHYVGQPDEAQYRERHHIFVEYLEDVFVPPENWTPVRKKKAMYWYACKEGLEGHKDHVKITHKMLVDLDTSQIPFPPTEPFKFAGREPAPKMGFLPRD